jgi:hypothetical protein
MSVITESAVNIYFASLSLDMESSAVEQRMNMKRCFNLGKAATETHGMLVKVYGERSCESKGGIQVA